MYSIVKKFEKTTAVYFSLLDEALQHEYGDEDAVEAIMDISVRVIQDGIALLNKLVEKIIDIGDPSTIPKELNVTE